LKRSCSTATNKKLKIALASRTTYTYTSAQSLHISSLSKTSQGYHAVPFHPGSLRFSAIDTGKHPQWLAGLLDAGRILNLALCAPCDRSFAERGLLVRDAMVRVPRLPNPTASASLLVCYGSAGSMNNVALEAWSLSSICEDRKSGPALSPQRLPALVHSIARLYGLLLRASAKHD